MSRPDKCFYSIKITHKNKGKCETKKQKFSNEKSAKREMHKQRSMGTSVIRCYKCPLCKGWHLTSQEDLYSDVGGSENFKKLCAGKKIKCSKLNKQKYKREKFECDILVPISEGGSGIVGGTLGVISIQGRITPIVPVNSGE